MPLVLRARSLIPPVRARPGWDWEGSHSPVVSPSLCGFRDGPLGSPRSGRVGSAGAFFSWFGPACAIRCELSRSGQAQNPVASHPIRGILACGCGQARPRPGAPYRSHAWTVAQALPVAPAPQKQKTEAILFYSPFSRGLAAGSILPAGYFWLSLRVFSRG